MDFDEFEARTGICHLGVWCRNFAASGGECGLAEEVSISAKYALDIALKNEFFMFETKTFLFDDLGYDNFSVMKRTPL